ncbi:hypothetical protein UU5_03767 [Rhodanobacter sp. 115]|nr:hypothetical protein UU5_03767 [Rhodanobacter sp. 115]
MVTYRTLAASRSIRDKVLVLTPQVDQGSITWSCGDSTIPYRELPRSCRQ